MVRKLAIVAGLATLLGAGVVVAATPFGGDDGGFIPPDSATLSCEKAVGKAVSKYVGCVIKCHARRAALKLADDTAEDKCEKVDPATGKGCGAKYDAAISKVATKCPGSCAAANGAMLKSLAEGTIDAANSKVYCKSPSGAFLDQ